MVTKLKSLNKDVTYIHYDDSLHGSRKGDIEIIRKWL